MYLLKSFLSLKMFIDPQSDVYAQYLQRKGDMEFPYRVNWEFQEQMRQHLLKTHAPDIINTTAFMNTPPSQFPQWTTPDLAQRQAMSGSGGMADEEAPQYRDMQYYEEEMPEQEEEVEYIDENGNPVENMTEEEKQQADAEKAQSTQEPQNVQKETATQHNDTPPPALKLEAPKSEPPSKPSMPTAQEVETQYNVPPASSQGTSTATPAKPQELSRYEKMKKYAADKVEAAKKYLKS
jgi:hypothetical protein